MCTDTYLNRSRVTMVAIIPIRERTTPIMVSTANVACIGDGIQSSNLEQISWITDE